MNIDFSIAVAMFYPYRICHFILSDVGGVFLAAADMSGSCDSPLFFFLGERTAQIFLIDDFPFRHVNNS